MAKFGFNDILNAKSKAAGAGAVTDYTEIWLNPHDVKPVSYTHLDVYKRQ